MNRDEFERRVRQSAAPHLKEREALDEAIRLVERERKVLRESQVRETIELAGRFHERHVRDKREADKDGKAANKGQRSFLLAPTPTDYLAGELLIEKLAPWVKALREDRFKDSNPQFKTVAEAAAWIENEGKEDFDQWGVKSAEREAAFEKIEELSAEYDIELDFKDTYLPYQKQGDDYVQQVYTVPRTYLHRLALETKRVAKKTGLAQDALVVHVLTGLRPALPRMRVGRSQRMWSLPNGGQIFARWATVTFFAKDLTYKEHTQAYNMVREHVGGKGTEGIGYRDLMFWWLMQEAGPPPEKGSVRFWKEEVLPRWKQIYPDVRPDTWQGVRKKYLDLRGRLERWRML
jgi:hypothetical protein